MKNVNKINLDMIKTVALKMESLIDKVAFLGGATTGLLITDTAAAEIRPTLDVDMIIEIISREEYYQLEEKLRALGFHQSMKKDDPICRWLIDDIIIDIMPTNEEILGFSNKWYPEALMNSVPMEMGENISLRIVTAPYFMATKIEAFYGRGNNDFMLSHDMEDIISVIDGRKELVEEISKSSYELRLFLSESFKKFLEDKSFIDSISANLSSDAASQARKPMIIDRIKKIVHLE